MFRHHKAYECGFAVQVAGSEKKKKVKLQNFSFHRLLLKIRAGPGGGVWTLTFYILLKESLRNLTLDHPPLLPCPAPHLLMAPCAPPPSSLPSAPISHVLLPFSPTPSKFLLALMVPFLVWWPILTLNINIQITIQAPHERVIGMAVFQFLTIHLTYFTVLSIVLQMLWFHFSLKLNKILLCICIGTLLVWVLCLVLIFISRVMHLADGGCVCAHALLQQLYKWTSSNPILLKNKLSMWLL